MAEFPSLITAPLFQVEGKPQPDLTRDIVRLEIEEDTLGLRKLVAIFIALGPRPGYAQEEQLYLDGSVFDFGRRVEVALGPRGSERVVFRGVLSAIENCAGEGAAPQVTVFAEDRLMRLRMTRRCRSYGSVTDADIARAIAAEHGMAADAEAEGPTYDVVQQLNQSDLAFLRERAHAIGAELWFDEDTLHFKSREVRPGAELTLTQGAELLALQVRADLSHQRSEVVVCGYDAAAREPIEETAGADVIQAEVTSGRSGPATLVRALGERPLLRTLDMPLTLEEAQARARTEMLRRSRAFVTAQGTTSGTPELAVGSRLTLLNIGKPFSGEGYYVTRVCHTYDLKSGYRTTFQAERATISEAR